jgi:hypothetical protein
VPTRRSLTEQEAILSRVDLLPTESDAALLRAVYGHGQSIAELARIRKERPGRTGRRVASLTRLLLSREFEFAMRHRSSLVGHRRSVATLCFIQGRSMREAARELGISFHAVRRHCEALRALMEGVS